MTKVVVGASSLPAGRNMSSQLDYIKKMQNFGADMYHLDVMDGLFVKNQTVDYTYLEQLKMSSILLFDVHLMVQNPTKVISKYAKAGANILTIHYEAFDDDKKFIKALKKIRKLGMMAGIALDLDTSVESIEPFLKCPPLPVTNLFLAIKPFICPSEKSQLNLSFIFFVISLYELFFTIDFKYSFSSLVHLCCFLLPLLPLGLTILTLQHFRDFCYIFSSIFFRL